MLVGDAAVGKSNLLAYYTSSAEVRVSVSHVFRHNTAVIIFHTT